MRLQSPKTPLLTIVMLACQGCTDSRNSSTHSSFPLTDEQLFASTSSFTDPHAIDRRSRGNESPPVSNHILSAEQLYTTAAPAVVTLSSLNDAGQVIKTGSGFLLARDAIPEMCTDTAHPNVATGDALDAPHLPSNAGYLVTNFHVIRGAVSVSAHFGNLTSGQDASRQSSAVKVTSRVTHVVTEDRDNDIAILAVRLDNSTLASCKPLEFSCKAPRIGAKVYTIGSPLGLANSLSDGLISGYRGDVIQFTCPISPGSSGGPLLAMDGTVCGITTATGTSGQNINFAVSTSALQRVLASKYRPRYLWKGVSLELVMIQDDGQIACNDHLKSAYQLYTDKRYDEATEYLRQSFDSIPPEDAHLAYWVIGLCLDSQAIANGICTPDQPEFARYKRETCQAIEWVENSIKKNPAFVQGHLRLSCMYGRIDMGPQSLRAAEKLVELMPDAADAYERRGEALRRNGQLTEAYEDGKAAVSLEPLGEGYFLLADVLDDLGKYEEAIAACESYVQEKRQGRSRMVWLKLSVLYEKKGRYLEAISSLRNFIEGLPSDSDLCLSINRAICRLERMHK